MQMVTEIVQPKVIEQMNMSLIQPFAREEISNAIKEMSPDKSTWVDGMSAMFFHKHWAIVGDSVTKVVLDIL